MKVRKEVIEKIIDMALQGRVCDEIMEACQVKDYVVYYALRKRGIKLKRPRTYEINENFFEVIDSHEKSYFLGFLYADGCVYDNDIQIGLQKRDAGFLQTLSDMIYVKHKPVKTTSNATYLKIHSRKMANDLIKLGCVERKTDKIRFPFDKIPSIYHHDFVRGYFDGDGTIVVSSVSKHGYKHWRTSITSKNLAFAIDMQKMLPTFKIAKHSQANVYNVYSNKHEEIIWFYNTFYYENCLCLNRKRDRFIESIETKRPGRGFRADLNSFNGH